MTTLGPITTRNARYGKSMLRTSLYQSPQSADSARYFIILESRSDGIDYAVGCFMTHDCSRKLWKQ